MLEWLRKKIGPDRTDLPAEAERLLADHLARLDQVGRGLGARALRFVAAGEDEGVLGELAARQGGAKALELKCAPGLHFLPGEDRGEMFRALPADPALHLRLALLYEAASRREQRGHAVDPALGLPDWLGVWLWEAGTYAPNTWRSHDESWASHELIEGMLAVGGERPDAAIRAAFRTPPPGAFAVARLPSLLTEIGDLPGAAARHPEAIAEALREGDAKHLVRVLEILAQRQVDLAPHAARLAALASSSAKTLRARALAILRGIPAVAAAPLRAIAAGGGPEERLHAVEALWEVCPGEARPFLADRLEAETAPRVKKAISTKLSGPVTAEVAGATAVALGAPVEPALDLAPLPEQVAGPLPPGAREALRRLADAWHRSGAERARRARAQNVRWVTPDPGPVKEDQLDAMVRYLEAPGRKAVAGEGFKTDHHWALGEEDVRAFLAHPGIGLVHAVRFLALAGYAEPWQGEIRWGNLVDRLLRHHRAAQGLGHGLREVGAALAGCGLDPASLGRTAIDGWGKRLFDWEPAAVWPHFQEHPEPIEEALDLRPATDARAYLRASRQTRALEVLESFPRAPDRFAGKLWAIALGSAKTDRAAAQRCLAKEPGTRARVVAALAEGRQETRAVAAEWLADLREVSAIPALETALAREKQDVARAALMGALEALGVAVDRFLDRPGLGKEAAKGLAKGIPGALSWFPFGALPAVRWADSGEQVPTDVLRWWVVQSHRLGSPEPGAVLRRYAQKLEPRAREALGRFVLEAWIAEDVRPPTPPELDALANTQAQQMSRWVQTPLAQLVEELRRTLAQQPAGSAAATKGVLAVAGACSGGDAAPLVQRYLKTWYGQRAAQCKALLQMLSFVEHPAAIQVVLATAARFRTAGIRKEAEACAHVIAERKGWTVADLADRTIPTGGFDDEGLLELDYGGRAFTAKLDDDLGVALAAADGKPVAALPDPRAGDDEEKVAGAKAALSAARKEIKATVKLQGERLYEAMCTERTWTSEDWDRYLHRHPVAGRLCRRLVWEARLGDARAGTFRPLGDGSLTGPSDEPFALPAGATVRLAHAATAPEEERRLWAEHLAAYEVAPLFDQLGRAPRQLAEADRGRTRLEAFQGHLVKAFRLRARAQKLGWVRGQAEDGGWFHVYRKHFPTLALEANVEFSGNSLPEEDRTVALHALHFLRTLAEGGPGVPEEVPLGEIPPVLLSECWNDLAALAAEGTGFDPEWERKVQP